MLTFEESILLIWCVISLLCDGILTTRIKFVNVSSVSLVTDDFDEWAQQKCYWRPLLWENFRWSNSTHLQFIEVCCIKKRSHLNGNWRPLGCCWWWRSITWWFIISSDCTQVWVFICPFDHLIISNGFFNRKVKNQINYYLVGMQKIWVILICRTVRTGIVFLR